MTTDFYKLVDPDATEDFSFDWTNYLSEIGNDTIATSTWSVSPSGPTLSNDSNTDYAAVCYISGCEAGIVYSLSNKIVTALGRTAERSISLRCAER